MLADYSVLRFNEHGLIPAIVQDVATGRVLMLAYMNREAIIYEMADLWFHAIVALGWHDVSPQEVLQELQHRFGKSGLRTNPRPPLHTTPEQSA